MVKKTFDVLLKEYKKAKYQLDGIDDMRELQIAKNDEAIDKINELSDLLEDQIVGLESNLEVLAEDAGICLSFD